MTATPPTQQSTLQEQVLKMVRSHQGLTLLELKTRMLASHGIDHKTTENAAARLRKAGAIENRSTVAHIPALCTPGCKSLPDKITPDQRAALATKHSIEKRSETLSTGKPICQPQNIGADLYKRIEHLLMSLPEGERMSAEQIACSLGVDRIDLRMVQAAVSQMVYRAIVISRLSKCKRHQVYSIAPDWSRAKLERPSSSFWEAITEEIQPGQYNPDAMHCDRADGKDFLACPSLRNGQRVPYGGIRGMCTGAAGPISHTPARLKQ